MLKRIIMTAAAISLIAGPVTGQQSDTDKARKVAKDEIIDRIQGFVGGLGDIWSPTMSNMSTCHLSKRTGLSVVKRQR